MKQSKEGRGKLPYKVWDSGRQVRKGLVASNFSELLEKGREKLELGDARLRLVLEADGTQVEDPEYFCTLPENTVFLLLRLGEHWYPAGVEVLKQAITAIPRIVCETIYSLGLHDEAPIWKIMDQYGKITVVLSWDPCHHRRESLKHGPSTSPRKPSTTARVIVSGVGETATTRHHQFLTTQTSFGSTPSPIPGVKSPIPSAMAIGGGLGGGLSSSVHGTITTIHRDGKKETLINNVGSSGPLHSHQGAVINHDGDHRSSFPGGSSAEGVLIGRLSRQGSSVESAHSATVHIHTPECCSYGHPNPTPRSQISPTGVDQTECDFHCCSLHEERGSGRSIHHSNRHYAQQHHQVIKTTSPVLDEKRSGGGGLQPVEKQNLAAQKGSSHVRFLSDYHSAEQKDQHQRIEAAAAAESSESETENTTNDDDGQTCEKFLLLIDQPTAEQTSKKHLSIKDIGVILDRLSSKIVDVERLDRDTEEDCFNWTIKAIIRGDSLPELGVLYGGHYYTICEHPAYGAVKPPEDEDDDVSKQESSEGLV